MNAQLPQHSPYFGVAALEGCDWELGTLEIGGVALNSEIQCRCGNDIKEDFDSEPGEIFMRQIDNAKNLSHNLQQHHEPVTFIHQILVLRGGEHNLPIVYKIKENGISKHNTKTGNRPPQGEGDIAEYQRKESKED